MAAKRKKTPKKFDAEAEVRSIARERVGTVKPSRPITPKAERRPKHKRDPLTEAEPE
jgi:hypothetical protein